MVISYSMFGQRLVERKLISQLQLDEAVHKQQTSMSQRKIGDILARLGYISKSHITEGLADQLGIPIVALASREIPERIRSLIGGDIATLYRVIPIDERDNTVVVATDDPTNINNLDNLARLLERPVEAALSTPEDVATALAKYYGLNEQSVETMLSTVSSASSMSSLSTMSNMTSLDGSLSSIGSMSSSDISLDSMSMSINVDELEDLSGGDGTDDDDSPVVQYINQSIMEAFRLRASDIHVEPGREDVKVRYRIDGTLHLMPLPPKRAQAAIISRIKIMAGMDITEKRLPQDGRIKMSMGTKDIDLRVSSLPASHGESIVMRILDKSGLMLGLGQLGFHPDDQRTWESMLDNSTGVLLVTGPTGSGKTTTLYASLHSLNSVENKIITVEDPVEYQLTGINQVQINQDIKYTFSRALRTIVRQDPDIIMVGEIRDAETAEIAIKSALTGHLVFSTLHTNDTSSTFARLIDIGVKPFLVASGVRVILAQRLVRTICTNCKAPYEAPKQEVARLGFSIDLSAIELHHGAGCDNCKDTGYMGRLGAYELLIVTDEIREMLMSGKSSAMLKRAARRAGMATMRQDAWRKALSGITTIEEVNCRTRLDEALPAEFLPEGAVVDLAAGGSA